MKTPIKILMIAFMPVVAFGCTQRSKQTDPAITPKSDTTENASKLLYIGTYTENESHGNEKSTGIYIYKLDLATGRLQYVSSSPATINPSYLDIEPDGKNLYAVNETGGSEPGSSGMVSAFRLVDQGKKMEFINQVSSAGNYPCYVQVDKSGRFTLAANYGSGTVALFPIHADGSLGEACSVEQHRGKGKAPRQEGPHAHMAQTSPDNRFIYSCDLGTDFIYSYHLNIEKGTLEPTNHHYATQPGSGPRHLAFHPFRNLAYVINELNGTIECLKVDSISGTLTRFQIIPTLDDGNGLEASCADIHITPSGDYLYASNRGKFNTIAMYSVDRQTGILTLIGHQPVKGKTPRNFVIDPSGTFLLVANQDSDNVVTFRIDAETGKLIDIGIETSIPTPVCLKFLPEKNKL